MGPSFPVLNTPTTTNFLFSSFYKSPPINNIQFPLLPKRTLHYQSLVSHTSFSSTLSASSCCHRSSCNSCSSLSRSPKNRHHLLTPALSATMAPVKVGINGFGRIGRIVFRNAIEVSASDSCFPFTSRIKLCETLSQDWSPACSIPPRTT